MKELFKNVRSRTSVAFLSGIIVLIQACNAGHGSLDFEGLTCESLENPMGIEQAKPLFSWVVIAEGYDRSQSAYQVLVATNPGALKPGKADMWDSGPCPNFRDSVMVLGSGTYNLTFTAINESWGIK